MQRWWADTAPADLRGTAFGVFNLASGVAMLVASVVAGALWDVYGPIATFLAGATFTAIALAGLLALRKQFRFRQHFISLEQSETVDGCEHGR